MRIIKIFIRAVVAISIAILAFITGKNIVYKSKEEKALVVKKKKEHELENTPANDIQSTDPNIVALLNSRDRIKSDLKNDIAAVLGKDTSTGTSNSQKDRRTD